ncbi:hypothetical protein [Luteibacter sp. UNCMF366Tsu5.1]|uniref:hypothetical protein n=1 Tax=Luteibacter sp. UNCMF366Tsu5.1 TaxID=1502758 RepID=UPI000908D4A4|nr:hypothetical protein [Luteibacter sp. UNCMF366Tsu5.1]SFW58330.1 hypothetical protein SAMN02800691_2319 [Luteibacter sp. UNCMF366Tsu5.1]
MRSRTIALSLWVAMGAASAAATIRAQGAKATPSAPPPAQGCDEIQTGPIYDVSAEPVGGIQCFQFLTNETVGSKLSVTIAAPAAKSSYDVHLARVGKDGEPKILATEPSGGAETFLQVVSPALSRWLVMIGGDGMRQGTPFQLQVDASGNPDWYEPNDTPTTPRLLQGNQHVVANLDSEYDVDYYVLSLPSSQQMTKLKFDGPSGVTLEVLQSGRWGAIPAGKVATLPSSKPLILRARKAQGLPHPSSSYTIHTSDAAGGSTVVTNKISDEDISHLAPTYGMTYLVPGGSNAARVLDVTASVYDSTGNHPAPMGEHVIVVAVDFDPVTKQKAILDTVEGYTDSDGEFSARLNIGECRGPGMQGPVRMHRISHPPVFWDITYVPTAYVTAFLDDGKVQRVTEFQHVCREWYRGSRP